MNNVATPIQITAWYDKVPDTPQKAEASPETKTSTTPEYHNILIQNVTATGYNTKNSNDKNYNGIMIYGRPESYVYDVTFDNVQISHRNGVRLFFCHDIKFINGCTFTKTRTNTTVPATAADLKAVMENSYQADYTWNSSTDIQAASFLQHSDSPRYDLSGISVASPVAGINICNGKKFIVK